MYAFPLDVFKIFNLHNLKGNGNKLELGAVFVCLPIWPPSEPPCFIGTLAGISTDKMCVTVRNFFFTLIVLEISQCYSQMF